MSVSSICFLLISQIWINECLTKLITKKEKNQIKNINFQKKNQSKSNSNVWFGRYLFIYRFVGYFCTCDRMVSEYGWLQCIHSVEILTTFDHSVLLMLYFCSGIGFVLFDLSFSCTWKMRTVVLSVWIGAFIVWMMYEVVDHYMASRNFLIFTSNSS